MGDILASHFGQVLGVLDEFGKCIACFGQTWADTQVCLRVCCEHEQKYGGVVGRIENCQFVKNDTRAGTRACSRPCFDPIFTPESYTGRDTPV